MNRDQAIEKIRKCLALSASSNEHEAQAALRQARKLMEAYNVSALDTEASQVDERQTRAGAHSRPAHWECALAIRIAETFGCEVIFRSDFVIKSGMLQRRGQWSFIGCDAAPEVATYAFSVLYRQAMRARLAHIRAALQRCKGNSRLRRADVFSEGWVVAVAGTIAAFASSDEHKTAIAAYIAQQHPKTDHLKTTDRVGNKVKARDYADFASGHSAGRDARLDRGIGTAGNPSLLEK